MSVFVDALLPFVIADGFSHHRCLRGIRDGNKAGSRKQTEERIIVPDGETEQMRLVRGGQRLRCSQM